MTQHRSEAKLWTNKKHVKILQRIGRFLRYDLQSDGDQLQLEFPQCPVRALLWSHQQIQSLPDRVSVWLGQK